MQDQSYAYYKQGMVFLNGINPSAWTKLNRTRHGFTHDDSRYEPEELLGIITNVLKKFNNALYCFSHARSANPHAPWADDMAGN